ncbi:M48 family metallopeptidase [Halomarina oriensis]|uniref:M48 family metalloprotease n=1 Tax=Halomarina oriensis TaxID=671145 RepID=A0A6B0GIB5_9EURY|nr:M48 family metalloprotease [Halomarina oriensis]MWG33179.1 M48 family metalloprotease [Halomarina oriensis]
MRLAVRVALAVVGVAVLVTYVGGAALLAVLLLDVVRGVDPATFVLSFGLLTVGLGYLSYRTGTARVLAGIGARDLPRERSPRLYARLNDLCDRMGLDTPRLMVVRTRTPNAFALGGTVVLDRALFHLLTVDELEGILAHELAHVERRDGLVGSLVFSVARTAVGLLAVALLPLALVLSGVARASALVAGRPRDWRETLAGRARTRIDRVVAGLLVASTAVVMARSRRRELAADDRAAEVTGDPLALARALARLDGPSWPFVREESAATRLLASHPDTDERIERLRERADRNATRIEVR